MMHGHVIPSLIHSLPHFYCIKYIWQSLRERFSVKPADFCFVEWQSHNVDDCDAIKPTTKTKNQPKQEQEPWIEQRIRVIIRYEQYYKRNRETSYPHLPLLAPTAMSSCL